MFCSGLAESEGGCGSAATAAAACKAMSAGESYRVPAGTAVCFAARVLHAVLFSYRCVQLMALDQQLDLQRATELCYQVPEVQSPPVMQRQQRQPLELQQQLGDAKSSPVVPFAISSLQEVAHNNCENTASVPAAPLAVTSPPSQGRYSPPSQGRYSNTFGDARVASPISPVSVSPRMYEPIFSVFLL